MAEAMEFASQTIPEFNEEIAGWIQLLAREWKPRQDLTVFADYIAEHMRQDANALQRDQERRDQITRDLLERTLPLLVRLGDFIGNGEIDQDRPGSMGQRCDLILDIKQALETK